MDREVSIPTNGTDRSPNDPDATPIIYCICNSPHQEVPGEIVQCRGYECKVGFYHAGCVELATRDPTTYVEWRCLSCRQQHEAHLPPTPKEEYDPDKPYSSKLSTEQRAVAKLILEGYNVCYCGGAWTGKSTILKATVEALRRQGKVVDIVAPSGIAAFAVDGQTTFSYAGLTPNSFKSGLDELLNHAHGRSIHKELSLTDVLFIAEISMLDSDMFTTLDKMCRSARGSWEPPLDKSRKSYHDANLRFGGVQIVVTGDFCQLPPVKPFQFCLACGGDELPKWKDSEGGPIDYPKCGTISDDDDKWAFKIDSWHHCDFKLVDLRQIWRQQDDPALTDILQKIRRCKPLLAAEKQLLLHHRSDTKDAVKVRPRLREVIDINFEEYDKLTGLERTYECLEFSDWDQERHPELANRFIRRTDEPYHNCKDGPFRDLNGDRYEGVLHLKFDTLVILLANLEPGFVNGSQGKVIGFQAYNKGGVKESRDSDKLSSFLPIAKGDHANQRDSQLRNFVQRRVVTEWPVVKFNNGSERVIYAHCVVSALGTRKPFSLRGRTQIPLMAVWAITIHKSQGMTLSRVDVDLRSAFEREQVYVALSRAKSLNGLEVHGLPQHLDNIPNAVVHRFLGEFQWSYNVAQEMSMIFG